MDVAALLPPRLISNLRIVLGTRHTLHTAQSWPELMGILRLRAVDVAVMDPCVDGDVAVDSVLQVRQHFPSLRLVIYTSVRPDSLHATVELARHGAGQLVLFRYDDSRAKFLALLEGQQGSALAMAVLAAIEPALAPLPQTLAAAIEDLFKNPARYRGATDLSTASGIGRRKLYRLHHSAGLASPWLVVAHARLLHAYAQLREGGHLFADIESRLGYSHGRLRALMRKLFDAPPKGVRTAYKPQAFIDRVVAQVYPGGAVTRRSPRKKTK